MPATQTSEVEIRTIEPCPTVAVRVTRTFADLPAAFPEHLPRIATRVSELGGTLAGSPYARYHGIDGDSVDLEIGAPVAAPVEGLRPIEDAESGEVADSALPGGEVAVLTHTGPYSTVGSAWSRIDGWFEETGRQPAGPGWEDYVDDPAKVPPDRLRTEIVVPLG